MQNKGQIAFVTGGGNGIGRAIAKRFAELGASVIVADLNLPAAEETVSLLAVEDAQKHAAVKMDVTNKQNILTVMDWVKESYGHLDILMNNAGVSSMNHISDLTEEEWDFNFNVNSKGVFLVTQAALPLMKENGGRIVNTCSMAAIKPDPTLAHYTASKFAVLGFTKACALEFAQYNITVNCVCPGYVKTDMQAREIVWEGKMRGLEPEQVLQGYINNTPLGRLCYPEDVADVVGFLVSPQAKFLTGEAMNVAGGANI